MLDCDCCHAAEGRFALHRGSFRTVAAQACKKVEFCAACSPFASGSETATCRSLGAAVFEGLGLHPSVLCEDTGVD